MDFFCLDPLSLIERSIFDQKTIHSYLKRVFHPEYHFVNGYQNSQFIGNKRDSIIIKYPLIKN